MRAAVHHCTATMIVHITSSLDAYLSCAVGNITLPQTIVKDLTYSTCNAGRLILSSLLLLLKNIIIIVCI